MLTGGTPPGEEAAPRAPATTALLLGAILLGSVLGAGAPAAGELLGGLADPVVLLLVGLLFFELRLDGFGSLWRAPRTALLAVGVNFLLIPVIALALVAPLPVDDAIRLGVLIYCLAPCTDWFLGFTRMAGGDTVTGAALIPLQMTLQLALYPVWLAVLTGRPADSVFTAAGPALLTWFVLPAGIGLGLRLLLRLAAPGRGRQPVLRLAERSVPFVIAALVMCLFAANVETILGSPGVFGWVLLVVLLFFASTYLIGELVARLLRLRFPEQALLTMTTSARNAPLMLAVTAIALPDQPLVSAAIVLGMLVEFPHLTVLTHLLRRREAGLRRAGAGAADSGSSLGISGSRP